ncbi:MAG: HEAT repeat domain-containing protein [Elusimicrobia bacterium]|nr:HEAT repeat domain-containing protein [Elusimicrobiota bacterium]
MVFWVFGISAVLWAQPAPSTVPDAPDVLEGLVKQARSGDPTQRRLALQELGQRRDPRALPVLRQALGDKKNPLVRSAALDALGIFRDRDSAKQVAELLLEDPEPSVRQSAAIALTYLQDIRTTPSLLEALRKESSTGVRYAVVRALSVLRAPEAVEPLCAEAASKDAGMQRSALAALSRMGLPGAQECVVEALGEANPAVRLEAIRAVGALGARSARGALKKIADESSEPLQNRLEAAWALALLEDSSGASLARQNLEDSSSEVRRVAIQILAEVGERKDLETLRRLRKSEEAPSIRQILDFAIQKLGMRFERKQPQ